MFSPFKSVLVSACGTSLFFIFYLVANTLPDIDNFNVDKLKNGDLDLSLTYFNSSKSFDPKFLPILEELGFNERTNFVDLNGPLPPVTFITATSENHAPEARNLTLRLARDHPSWKIVIYDIGLEPETRKWFEVACNLNIRNINLTQYGVTLDNYRWKPIVIAVALLEFPAVFWMDTSTHVAPFITKDQMLIELDPQPNSKEPNHYIFSLIRHSTYAVTSKGMYDYLRPQGNIYKMQYEASKQLLIRTRSTYELSLKWWVLCALEKACLAPEGHIMGWVLDQDRVATLVGCNRLRYFDSFNSFDKKYLPELERLGLADLENKNDFIDLDEETPLPVMVTAASASHVAEARGLVTRMARSYPTWRIVFYDIGLEAMTRKWFQDACNVDFRIFNLTHYGIKTDNKQHGDYRWKPLIMALTLLDFPAVMWIDTSIIWSPHKSLGSFVRDISPLRSDKIPNHYLFMSADHATLPVTNKEMYSYLKPQHGPFKENYDAAAQLLFRTKSTYKLSLKWLVLCALEPKCIAPEGSQIYCNFKLGEEKNKVFAGCHRYDQSAVNIILSPYSTSYALYGAAGYFNKMGGLDDEEVPVLCYNSINKIFINNA